MAKHFTGEVPLRGVAHGSASRARPLGFFQWVRFGGRRNKNLFAFVSSRCDEQERSLEFAFPFSHENVPPPHVRGRRSDVTGGGCVGASSPVERV